MRRDPRKPPNALAPESLRVVDNRCRVVILPTKRSADVIKLLEADGWMLRYVAGSHHVSRHAVKPGHVSVPHPKKDLGAGLVHKVLNQAGLR
jgi:predicted RNA binding protein YcfA (HicA-like mRNA interferase family)